jgi:hypothetical protein
MKLTKNAFETIRPKVEGAVQAEVIRQKDLKSTRTESTENFGKGTAVLSVIAIILAIALVFITPLPRPETVLTDFPLQSPNFCCATIVAEISSR